MLPGAWVYFRGFAVSLGINDILACSWTQSLQSLFPSKFIWESLPFGGLFFGRLSWRQIDKKLKKGVNAKNGCHDTR
jgi:hypothetical protein